MMEREKRCQIDGKMSCISVFKNDGIYDKKCEKKEGVKNRGASDDGIICVVIGY